MFACNHLQCSQRSVVWKSCSFLLTHAVHTHYWGFDLMLSINDHHAFKLYDSMFMCRRGGTIDTCRRTVVTWRFGSWSITFSFTPQRNVAMTQTVPSAVQYGLFKHCQWPRRSSKVQKICTYCDLYLIAFSCNFCTNYHFLRMPWPDLALTFGDIMAASENILRGEDNLTTQKICIKIERNCDRNRS